VPPLSSTIEASSKRAMTDDELAAAFVARRPQALEEAYRRYAGVLHAVARNALGESFEAADCVHDTVLRIWLAADSYREARGSLRAFLIVCVRNQALTRRRDAARHVTLERRNARFEATSEGPHEIPDYVEVRRLQAALSSLPAEQRTVIELAYYGGRSQTEIARELGAPLGTIKSRAALGLRKLMSALGPARTTI